MNSFRPSDIIVPKNGIKLSALSSKLNSGLVQSLTCKICHNLSWEFLSCANCGSLFCRCCITNSITKSISACPSCESSPFKPSENKALTNLFSNVLLKCPNFPLCKEVVSYSEYLTHQLKCKYRKYHCVNDGCNFEINLHKSRAMEKHSIKCPHKLVKCRLCEREVKKMDLNTHILNLCTKFKKCEKCRKEMTKSEFENNHSEADCLRNQIEIYKAEKKDSDKKLKKLEIVRHEESVKYMEDRANWSKNFQELKLRNVYWENKFTACLQDYLSLKKKLFLNRKRERDNEDN